MYGSTRQLVERFKKNFRNPRLRRNVAIRMAGKLLGMGMVIVAITTVVPGMVHAAAPGLDATPEINAINTMWVLIAAFLVFCMQVGFEMLEAGFARSREAVNILVEGIADTCICGIAFWAWGYAFMFGTGTPFIGTTGFLLQGLPETFGTTGSPPAPWSAAPASSATCSTASASPASFTPSSATGPGVPTASWP